jgi:GNAT superfamily N-acetyltransferase
LRVREEHADACLLGRWQLHAWQGVKRQLRGGEDNVDFRVVKSVAAEDEVPAIETIVLAFAADPVARWTWPRSHQFLAAMPNFVRAFAGSAFTLGGADCTKECTGAALWLPPGTHPDEARVADLMERTASPSARNDSPAIFEQMAKYHPSEPHWYLPLIGVDPAHQGKGLGDALLAYALERCDRDKLPAYLESTNPRNVSLYRRHGFQPLGTIQVGSSPTLVPMLRRSR